MANVKKFVFKKGKKGLKENYRPISILNLVLKIFERIIWEQLKTFIDNILPKYQCRFRKGHGTKHCLLLMLEKWKKALDNKEAFGALLTDLSKAFDYHNPELLMAKLHTYSLSLSSLKFVHDCLLNGKQRTKVNSKYSSLADILEGIPQGSMLGLLLSNIFLCDLFIIIDTAYFAGYTDDNTPYVTKSTIEEVLYEPETVSKCF